MRRAPQDASPRRLTLLGSLVLLGCGAEARDLLVEPPIPAGLEVFDERVVERIERLEEAVREAPDRAQGWIDLAMLYEVEGIRGMALECYDQGLARRDDQPRWWYRTAVVQWRRGELRDAIRRIDRSIALQPNYAPSYYRRGSFHLELGELDPAEAAFQRAIELDPDFGGGWVGQARVCLQRDQSARAVEILEQLFERDADDRSVRRLLVTAYRQAGLDRELPPAQAGGDEDGETGILWNDPWQTALRKKRRVPEMQKVTTMLRDGEAERAIEILERRLEEEPEETDTLLHLAEAYYRDGRTNKARKHFRLYLEHEPDNIAARQGLARIHESEKLPHLAIQKLDEIIAIQPTFAPAHVMKGRILYQNLQYQAAVPVLERALELDQRNGELWLWLGHSLIGLDRWEEAEATFLTALEQDEADGEAWVGLAKARTKLKKFGQADEALARADACGVDPDGLRQQVGEALEGARRRRERSRDR